MNEIERLKTLFPRASKSFIDANAGLPAVERKQDSVRSLAGKISREAKSDARPSVSIVMFRVRLLDKENAYTATKSLTDCLREVDLIPGDSESDIDLSVTQEKVNHYSEQRTTLHIKYP